MNNLCTVRMSCSSNFYYDSAAFVFCYVSEESNGTFLRKPKEHPGCFITPNRPVRDEWEYPRKMEGHFPIKPGQAIGMALVIFYSFLNSLISEIALPK